jgi:transcription elongation factor
LNVDTRDLDICEVQGPSSRKSDPVDPLVGQNVVVCHGPLKGLYGRVKDVGSDTLTVELEAKVATSKYSRQPLMRNDVKVV